MSLSSTTSEPGASIPIASVPNLRDLGGWPTVHGTHVRRGLLYRSAALDHLGGADDVAAFTALGIRSVFDLRTRTERRAKGDLVPPGTRLIALDVVADSPTPTSLHGVMADPPAAQRMLGDGRAALVFEAAYRELVTLPSAHRAYGQLFANLADQEHRPALVHCSAGKDRTGWAAATLLLLLGVSLADVTHDYLLTNERMASTFGAILDGFELIGGDPALLRPLILVSPAYLETTLETTTSAYGSIEGYFAEALGIDAATQQLLRSELLEPDD